VKATPNNHPQRSWPWWRRILTLLNIGALGLSVILSLHFLKGGPMVGCGGGSPCEHVLHSQWSMIAGILPVSGLAVGVYLAMLVAGFFIVPPTEAPIRRQAWGVMLILAGSVAGSAIWFTIIQKWVIGDFCPYCMTMHTTGLLLAALVIWRAISESDCLPGAIPFMNQGMVKNVSPTIPKHIIRPLHALGLVLIGLVLAGILAAFQAGFSPPVVYRDGVSKDNLPAMDYHTGPIVGSPDAPYIVILLFDYQCSHCQQIHFLLEEAVRRYNGTLAFALCPSPLNLQCNPYIPRDADEFRNSCELTRIALTVWRAKKEVFPAFENWMFTFESGERWLPRSLEAARAKALEIVGQKKFEATCTDLWIGQYLQTCIRTFGQTIQNGKGGVPKLIFGSRWVIPEPHNTDDLVMILQKSLAVPGP
jgi:uncharacterized membrane protein